MSQNKTQNRDSNFVKKDFRKEERSIHYRATYLRRSGNFEEGKDLC